MNSMNIDSAEDVARHVYEDITDADYESSSSFAGGSCWVVTQGNVTFQVGPHAVEAGSMAWEVFVTNTDGTRETVACDSYGIDDRESAERQIREAITAMYEWVV